MECSDNVGDREDKSNSYGNEEIQLGSTSNKRNTLDPSWTAKASFGRDAVVLQSRRGTCSTHPESFSDAVQRSTQIKSGKAAGPDNIPAEALKADVAITAKILYIIFSKVWDEEQVPTDWKEGLLVKIPKAISATVITAGASLFSQYQENSSTRYC
ncbi:unnamed protein product [Schistosoma curassoni]|uniref:Peroxisomal membrane protein PEX16 n=1 Tax=Schistosoma curassoni TaxID=6186 RepID=A0A183L4J4_9TREM|nr:unnamed protein product [Schistosoma curassoni]